MAYNTDYILPIFKLINGKREYLGTGFIVEDKLYAPATLFHKKKDFSRYSFLFNGEYIQLKNILFSEWPEDTFSSVYKDLAIFKVDNIISPYRFFEGANYPYTLYFHGYSGDGYDKIEPDTCFVSVRKNAMLYPDGYPDIPAVELENVARIFSIQNMEIYGYPLTPDHYGTPIIDEDNYIYGMYVDSNDDPEVEYILKAEYISGII